MFCPVRGANRRARAARGKRAARQPAASTAAGAARAQGHTPAGGPGGGGAPPAAPGRAACAHRAGAEAAAARVERISAAAPELLQFFAQHGVGVGTELEARAGSPFSGSLGVLVGGGTEVRPLGTAATDAVRVTPLG